MHIQVHMLYAGAPSVQRTREHVTPIVPLLTNYIHIINSKIQTTWWDNVLIVFII